MKLLLDTHTFMWWDSEPSQLSKRVDAAMRDPANEIVLSVISIWEMSIKAQLGKLNLRIPLANIVAEQRANGLRLLPVSLEHVLEVERLPPIHRDPFDRLLAAQSIIEGLEFATKDAIFENYPVRLFW
jgi:PIN domain nuclease of toxin-antitoxin system